MSTNHDEETFSTGTPSSTYTDVPISFTRYLGDLDHAVIDVYVNSDPVMSIDCSQAKDLAQWLMEWVRDTETPNWPAIRKLLGL